MEKAYTFDDILILPAYSDIEREDVDIRSYFHWYCLSVPVMSSPMDTITGQLMMNSIYETGGLGFHHRYCGWEVMTDALFAPGGIAVSPSMGIDNILGMFEGLEQYPMLVLDVAHGHTKKNLEFCKELVRSGCVVISGNVASPKAVDDYLNVGVRDFRLGIGSGSVCKTRTVTGVGMPQASLIKWIHTNFKDEITIISDGGHKTTGDIVKALALGADFVMLGGMLAGCDEVPKVKKEEEDKITYRGMASEEARTDYGKHDVIAEGVVKKVEPKGPVAGVLREIEQAIKLACYYVGARNIKELRERSEIIFVTENGYLEGLPR